LVVAVNRRLSAAWIEMSIPRRVLSPGEGVPIRARKSPTGGWVERPNRRPLSRRQDPPRFAHSIYVGDERVVRTNTTSAAIASSTRPTAVT
jgi:hypothetical protein